MRFDDLATALVVFLVKRIQLLINLMPSILHGHKDPTFCYAYWIE